MIQSGQLKFPLTSVPNQGQGYHDLPSLTASFSPAFKNTPKIVLSIAGNDNCGNAPSGFENWDITSVTVTSSNQNSFTATVMLYVPDGGSVSSSYPILINWIAYDEVTIR